MDRFDAGLRLKQSIRGRSSDESIVIVAQIEDVAAVRDVEAIAAIAELDALFIVSSDQHKLRESAASMAADFRITTGEARG